MNTSRPQLVVLDMAGTTVKDDDAVNRCLRQALEGHGVVVSRDEVNAVMGHPKPAAIRTLLEGRFPDRLITTDEVNRVHDTFLASMVEFYRSDPHVGEAPGATAVLRRLKQAGMRVALDTGFSRPIVDAILSRLEWAGDGLLDTTVASDEVERGRPHADLILQAMKLTGVTDPRAVAKIGDTPSDLLEGQAAGCGWVIGVTNGTHTRDQLLAYPHTALIDSLEELPEVLLGSSK